MPRKIIEIASIFAFIIIVEFWAGDETVRWGARYMIWGAKYMCRWVWGLPPPPFWILGLAPTRCPHVYCRRSKAWVGQTPGT
jgi:hypothetical protein